MIPATIQIAANAVDARIINPPREVKLIASELLTYFVEGAEMSDAYRNHTWDGTNTFYNMRKDIFPAGFLNIMYHHLTEKGYQVQVVKKPLPEPKGHPAPKVDNFPDDPRYDYQYQTVESMLQYGQMVAMLATGGGKGRVARIAYARIKRPTLFLTTRGILMWQMKEGIEQNMKVKVGVIGDQIWEPRPNGFTVAMIQTLASYIKERTVEKEMKSLIERDPDTYERMESAGKLQEYLRSLIKPAQARVKEAEVRRTKVLAFLEKVELVILEEAHESSGNSYYDVMRLCKNAHYRLALTATPFMKSNDEANMRLMACSGPIGIRVSEATLIERGILATPYFRYIRGLPKPEELKSGTYWQKAYTLGIVENKYRNAQIVKEAQKAVDAGLSTMILVQQKKHGKTLKDALIKAGIKTDFIFGETNQDNRKAALSALQMGDIEVLIGSTILDVGVDVPAVGMIILAGGGKAEVSLRQRIGRGLRAKKNGPNVTFIVDFMDEHNQYLRLHAQQRRAIVVDTPGFFEHVLPDNAEFDFKGLGL